MGRVALILLCLPAAVWADGGMVRLVRRMDDLRVTVFTSPTPLRAGWVDVSVLVQDAETGTPRTDLPVRVTGRGATESVTAEATREAATNKLFRAALLELPEGGVWTFEVTVGDGAAVTFEAELAGPVPAWLDLLPWVGWPFVVAALFLVHQLLVTRRAARRR